MTALRDFEIFHSEDYPGYRDDTGRSLPVGWYYWFYLLGGVLDSDPIGPFTTMDAAADSVVSKIRQADSAVNVGF